MRRRYNFIHGTIEDGLTDDETTLQSAGLSELPAVTSPDYVVIILDPTQRAGDPEIAYVIDHAEGSSGAVIARGQEGSTARPHDADIPWVHGLVVEDINKAFSPDNMGPGTGLNADLLDGFDGTTYARTYTHSQDIPSDTWVITHNLGRMPGVSVVDSAGSQVYGDIQYNDTNTITIRFSAAFAGKAHFD